MFTVWELKFHNLDLIHTRMLALNRLYYLSASLDFFARIEGVDFQLITHIPY